MNDTSMEDLNVQVCKKPYTCEMCHMEIEQKYILMRHLHILEINHFNVIYVKNSSSKNYLSQHLKQHQHLVCGPEKIAHFIQNSM